MLASNCGYIGIDPDDAIQHLNDVATDNPSLCAASLTYSYFRWTNGWCSLMPCQASRVYYNEGNCIAYVEYVVNRNPSNPLEDAQVSTYCACVGGAYSSSIETDVFAC